MIQASIVPTRSLRAIGSEATPERKTPTRLRDGGSATADHPVVLLRGCTPIDLRVIVGGMSPPRVTWQVRSLQSNNAALTPALFPPISMFSRLGTDAVGLYRVTATIARASGPTTQHHWHVRFIDLRVPDDPTGVEDGGLSIRYGHQYAGTASVGAAFGFTVGVSLSGAGDDTQQYDQVTVGILQNLSLATAAQSPSGYALCGIGGHLEFISAVAAFSAEARFNYVVFEKYVFTMEVNAVAPGRTLKQKRPFADTATLGIPDNAPCFHLASYTTLRTPADAREVGMESYGPVATSGGGQYHWTTP